MEEAERKKKEKDNNKIEELKKGNEIKEKDEYRLKINTKKDKPVLSENQREENILNSIILIYLLLLILFNF